MKGLIVINAYSQIKSELFQSGRLKEEFAKIGVETEICRNDKFFAGIYNGKIETDVKDFDFCVYLDKDKYVSKLLEDGGLRVFNKHDAISACDDKMETSIALANSNVAMPDTISGLLCYTKDAVVKQETVELVENKLGYPLVVKESYGSMGKGVYLVKNRNELLEVVENLKFKPHLFQKFIESSRGKDARIIVIGGKSFAWMIRRNDNDFRSNVEIGGIGENVDLPKEFFELAEKVSSLLHLDYCGVDLLFGANGKPMLCEANSNAFFGGIEKVTQKNVAKRYAEYIVETMNKQLK